MKFRDFLKQNTVILDGAMGTMLQKSGLKLGEMPESFNITNPDVIVDIHRQYLNAGSNVIYCNTFGANRRKLSHCGYSVKEVISSAVTNAKKAIEGFDNAYVALDIGPIGELLEPIGTLKFDEAYDIFKEQMVIGEKCGADLIVIETMTDLSEARIALLAARENTSLPVFCSMSFEDNMRTFTGSDVISMAKVLEGLGADAIGINCSLGPAQIYPIAKKLCENSNIPVFVKANAGLPSPDGLSYDTTPLDFAKSSAKFKELGINILGGCCGTTPEYIKNLKTEAEKIPLGSCQKSDINYICSASSPVSLDRVRIIGERINPTGKKLFKEALIKGDMDYILKQAIEQVDAGADILDINVGLPEIDEVEMMTKVVKAVSSVVNVPLQIDSSNPKAIEAGLRAFCGKAIVNSVNGEQKVLDNILPIAKKYGAAVVGLTLDENGIPPKAEDRVKIAKRILNVATSYGIKKEDLFIDCLTLTVSAEQENASQTLSAVSMVRDELGLKTVLGVSNISFGLPQREIINKTFLSMALTSGLDLPIINPNIKSMVDTIYAFNVLFNVDKNSELYIERFKDTDSTSTTSCGSNEKAKDIAYCILKGLNEECKMACNELLKSHKPLTIVDNFLIPALDNVGNLYESGKIFLPQLIMSAEAAKFAFDAIKEHLANSGDNAESKGTIVLATVKGDIHDIGKNIVKVILENYGYDIIDLGRDVPADDIVSAAKKHNAKMVGLSALMTTTVKSMEETIKALRDAKLPCKICVGGAVLTPDYAEKIGADYYAKDANEAVHIAKEIFKS